MPEYEYDKDCEKRVSEIIEQCEPRKNLDTICCECVTSRWDFRRDRSIALALADESADVAIADLQTDKTQGERK